jgi:hypothetical protein
MPSPQGAYPTSPPWAHAQLPPPPEPPPAPTWPEIPHTPHGGLLVPYPEEMANAARPKPPSWVPVVIFTLLFGVLGSISAKRRATVARRTRNDQHPYWIAFGATMAVGLVAWVVAALGFLVPVYLDFREGVVTKVVEGNVVSADKRVSSAACVPVGDRTADGLRTYRCTITLTSGRSGTTQVQADEAGQLQAAA